MNINKKLDTLIFGLNDYADLAYHYLTTDSNYRPVGFFVTDKEYRTAGKHHGLPVYTAEELTVRGKHYMAETTNMFAPCRDNKLRMSLFQFGIAAGYDFISYISSKAIVNGKVGLNCFIQELNNIQPFAEVKDNCILWAGNHIGHHSSIESATTITSHCVISGHCIIDELCYIGVNATIRDSVYICAESIVGQGSNVVKNISHPGTYIGNPAKLIV